MIAWIRRSDVYVLYLKNGWDYAWYLTRLQPGGAVELTIDVVMWVASAILLYNKLFVPLAVTTIVAVSGTIRGIFKFRRSAARFLMRREGVIKQETVIAAGLGRIPLERILPSDLEATAGFSVCPYAGETVVRSDAFDAEIRSGTGAGGLSVETDQAAMGRVRANIKGHKDVVVPLLTAQFRKSFGTNQFHNDRKLCLSDDLLRAQTCVVHVGGYFDTFVTNDIGAYSVRDRDDNRRVVNGGSLFPVVGSTAAPRLCRIGESNLNNHLGVATLAVTRDRKLVIWEQNWRAMQSNGMLVPTGSGSSDARDRAPTLVETMRNTMERELREESAKHGIELPQDAVHQTKVIGFYRHVRRGGKPEFVGVTRLRVNERVLQPDRSEVSNPSDETPRAWLAGSMNELIASIDEILTLPRISLPLAVALDVLRRYLRAEPAEATALLFEPLDDAPSTSSGAAM